MKTKIKLVVILVVSISMVIGGLLFAINYRKESSRIFYNDGYIINNIYDNEESNINKIYFDANTQYLSHSNNEYSFTNTEGNKSIVSNESFVHYNNGSIMSLKNGVAIDLNNIDSKLLRYYNIFEGSILSKTSTGYEINNLNDTVTFEKLMYKISNNKYLVSSPSILISFYDDQSVSVNDYIEIEYVNENIIRIYNDEVNYQTIASNLYLVMDNIKIDLEYKKISKNNISYLTMADMVINADDNIEILPEPEKKEEGSVPDDKNNETNNNGEQSGETKPNTGIIDNIPNIEPNETIDEETNIIQPKFTIESMDVTTLGFENLKISSIDESNILYGNRTVEIIENSTGKVIQNFEQWEAGIQNYTINSYFSLKPNSSYTLNVVGQYKIEDTIYDRTFISKMFRTLDIGLQIEKDYVTNDSISFIVYKNAYSDVSGFTYNIKDLKDNVIVEDTKVKYYDEDYVVLTEEGLFQPNNEYEITIKNIQYGNDVFSTVSYQELQLTHKIKTLKSYPLNDLELKGSTDSQKNTITFEIENINDTNGGIKSYTYKIYDIEDNLVYTTTMDKYNPLKQNVGDLGQGEKFYFNVEIAFDDNEKTIIYTSTNSDVISTNDLAYPQVLKYESSSSNLDCETLEGIITLDDKDNFIPLNKIKKYRIIIKEKANPSLGTQQNSGELEIETVSSNSNISIPVYFTGLKPATEYVLYVYLEYNNKYIYLGYENVETREPEPIYLNEQIDTTNNSNIFAFEITKGMATTSENVLKSVTLELFGCSTSTDICSTTHLKRTIPKYQDGLELIDMLQNESIVKVNSSEFNFFVENYNSDLYYKVIATGRATDYDIPVKINETDSNEFLIEPYEMPPELEIKPTSILNSDCIEGSECFEYYKETDLNNKLDLETIVGFNFYIKTIRNVMGTAVEKIHYDIYESNDCSIKTTVLESSERELQTVEDNIFIPVGNTNSISLKRGKSYCVEYYGEYGVDKLLTDKKNFSISSLKQPSQIKGYLKNYTGTTATFNLNINDPDNSLIDIKLSNIDAEKNNDEYTFNGLTNGQNYILKIKENIGNGSKEYKIYDDVFEPVTLLNDINIIVDTSQSGKIIFKLPHTECELIEGCITNKNLYNNLDRIAGLLLNNTYLKIENINDEIIAEINLSDIEQYGLSINNGYIDIENIKIVYDNGEVVDYRESGNKFFIKTLNGDVLNRYYNFDNKFTPISIKSIFSYDSNILSNVKLLEFSSKIDGSSIGNSISISNDLTDRLIKFNKVKLSLTKLYDDSDKQVKKSFKVNEVLSTSEINQVVTPLGSKVSFDITSKYIKENTVLKVLLSGNGELVEEKTISYQNGSWNNYSGDGKIKNISSNGSGINIEFVNINDDKVYKYSLLYSNSSQEYMGTYNDSSRLTNIDIFVTSFKSLNITNYTATYSKSYWNWDSTNYLDLNFIKRIVSKFEVNPSLYELGNNEKIKFNLEARNINDSLDKTVLENNLYLNQNLDNGISVNSIDTNLDTLNKNLNGVYEIVLIPIIESTNEPIKLEERVLGEITITNLEPTISIGTTKEPFFRIEMQDLDGVLGICQSNYYEDELKYVLNSNPMGYINQETNTYFNDLGNKKLTKAAYFELYSSNNIRRGYAVIPFVYKTSELKLYDYFDRQNLPTGNYDVKVKYCINGILKTKEFNDFYIYNAGSLNFNMIRIPDSYILLMENPDEEIKNKIKRIKYQYTLSNGVVKIKELNNLDLNINNDIEYTVSKNETGKSTYYLGLSVDGELTALIKNLEIRFYETESDDSLITVYSK